MLQIVVIGLGAGAAAALLLASVVSGSIPAVLLFYLAPLPIMIAALGWSHLAGLIAAVFSTTLIVVLSGTLFFLPIAAITFGAWWLGYLTLLARPTRNGGGAELEWYPIGRLLLWAAVIGTLTVAAALPIFGTDQQSLEAVLRRTYQRVLRDPAVIDVLVVAVPPAAAVFSTIINVFNLWLAARVVKISGHLKRPWPQLSMLTLPLSSVGVLVIAVIGYLLPDLLGILSGAFAASLLMVFALLGFAVLHVITLGTTGRNWMLAGVYTAAALVGWPVVAVAMLGLAETVFNIRLRVANQRRPPSLPTQ